jgi:hypothetical protein
MCLLGSHSPYDTGDRVFVDRAYRILVTAVHPFTLC